jgi:hypothetical protein
VYLYHEVGDVTLCDLYMGFILYLSLSLSLSLLWHTHTHTQLEFATGGFFHSFYAVQFNASAVPDELWVPDRGFYREPVVELYISDVNTNELSDWYVCTCACMRVCVCVCVCVMHFVSPMYAHPRINIHTYVYV